MASANRNYQLPNKHHDVVEDITAMRETFAQIDRDVTEIENQNVATIIDIASATMLQANITNPEIQNIAPGRFIAIDSDGVTCIDGSGNNGGSPGQCTVKKSNANFDQGWSDILETSANCQTVKLNATEATGSDTIILCDAFDSSESLKPEFVYLQSIDDVEANNNRLFLQTL